MELELKKPTYIACDISLLAQDMIVYIQPKPQLLDRAINNFFVRRFFENMSDHTKRKQRKSKLVIRIWKASKELTVRKSSQI